MPKLEYGTCRESCPVYTECETRIHFAQHTLKEAGFVVGKTLDDIINADGGRFAHHMDTFYDEKAKTLRFCPNCGKEVGNDGPCQHDGMEWHCENCEATFDVIIWKDVVTVSE